MGDNLDSQVIDATDVDGVLHVTVPVAERAKPRKVQITSTDPASEPIEAKAH